MTSLSCHCFPGLEEEEYEEEEEGQLSLEQTATSATAGEEEEGELGEGLFPLTISKYFTDKRGRRCMRERNVV